MDDQSIYEDIESSWAKAEEQSKQFPDFVNDKTSWTHGDNWDIDPSFLESAIVIASLAHACQRDKNGRPYILHCLRVMMRGKTDDEKAVGVLHDILEDTDTTTFEILAEGIPLHIVEAVVALSHNEKANEPRKQYYDRIKSNPLAHVVKRYDLDDNTSPERFAEIDEKNKPRLKKKYREAYEYLYGFVPEHLNEPA
jgi:hypothetical protein